MVTTNQFKDIQLSSAIPGFLALAVILFLNVCLGYFTFSLFTTGSILFSLFSGVLFMISLFLYSGLKTINPGEAVIFVFFGLTHYTMELVLQLNKSIVLLMF